MAKKLQIVAVIDAAAPISTTAIAGQGIYADVVTITEDESASLRVSADISMVTLSIRNFVSNTTVYNASVTGTEQLDGPEPWIDAEWPRAESVPPLAPEFYVAEVPSTTIVPSQISLIATVDTYRMPIFVVPTTPTADVLFVSPSVTNMA